MHENFLLDPVPYSIPPALTKLYCRIVLILMRRDKHVLWGLPSCPLALLLALTPRGKEAAPSTFWEG